MWGHVGVRTLRDTANSAKRANLPPHRRGAVSRRGWTWTRCNVALRFYGEHALRVDDKCRLAIPVAYRQALQAQGDARLVLTRSLSVSTSGRCLLGFSIEAWNAYLDKVRALPQSDPAVVAVLRLQVPLLLEPDGQGRVVLSPTLRAWAGIDPSSEVVCASQMDRFEIWARDAWTAEQERLIEALPGLSDRLAALGL